MHSSAAQRQAVRLPMEHCPRELELLFRAILHYSSEPILVVDDNRNYLDANSGAAKLLGLSKDRVIGRRIDDFAESGFKPRIERLWRDFLARGQMEGTFRLVGSDGTVREVEYAVRGNVLPMRHLLTLNDKPKEKQGTVWARDYAIFLLDVDGLVAAWYNGAERLYGYKAFEVAGRHESFLIGAEENAREAPGRFRKSAAAGHVGGEAWHTRKDGSRFWANVLTVAFKGENGELVGFASVVRDFSNRRGPRENSPQPAGRPVARLPAVARVSGVVSGGFDRIIEASDAFLEMVGYSREEVVGRLHWPDLVAPEFLDRDDRAHEEAMRFGACTPYETECVRKDGGRAGVLVAGAVLSLAPYRWISLVQRSGEDPEHLEPAEAQPAPARFAEIIGNSVAMKRVLGLVELVAPTDATVLLLGETGTGKELMARALHRLSIRREQPFIVLNCAAIPTGLLESELFGYEKGAFTGALSRKVGRFELAHQGTLFLDEVGDIPLELQPKLLRALQEKEFERLGGTRTIPIDVRLIAATNRNLAQMMEDKLFRSDLYYRLKVFPITTPSLRDRPEDIPMLARYFVQKYAQQMNRQVEKIPPETMHALVTWPWPGNVRELENFIERAVILSQGPALRAPLAELRADAAAVPGGFTLAEVEREHIIRIFRESGGVVSRAAARLGLPRTTLNAMMRKLGITRKDL